MLVILAVALAAIVLPAAAFVAYTAITRVKLDNGTIVCATPEKPAHFSDWNVAGHRPHQCAFVGD